MSVEASQYGTSYNSSDSSFSDEAQTKRVDQLLEQKIKQAFGSEGEFPQKELKQTFDDANQFPKEELRVMFKSADEFPKKELEVLFSLVQQYQVDGRASVSEENIKRLFDEDFDVEEERDEYTLDHITTSCGIVSVGCGICNC